MQIASKGTQQVSSNVNDITQTASHAKEASLKMLDSTQTLSKEIEKLRSDITSFLDEVRGS
jgi:methyl-accepting chemotaxis protein